MENICRTCMRAPEKLLSLFENEDLIKKIEFLSSIEISVTDKLPSTVCEECITNINHSYNFCRVIINNDVELKERILALENTNISSPSSLENENIELVNDEVITDVSVEDVQKVPDKKLFNFRQSLIGYKHKVRTCEKCNFTTTEAEKWRNHRKSHISRRVCNICGKVLRSDNLTKHIRSHTEEPINCSICNKVLKNSQSMRSHMFLHKEDVYQCKICGNNYKYRGEYNRHVKRHYDQKKIKCPLCDKTFNDKKHIKNHIRSHTGERPYQCNYCKKGFSSTYARKVHMRQHTNEKPFICEFCPMAFHQKVSLFTHIKSKHTEDHSETSQDANLC